MTHNEGMANLRMALPLVLRDDRFALAQSGDLSLGMDMGDPQLPRPVLMRCCALIPLRMSLRQLAAHFCSVKTGSPGQAARIEDTRQARKMACAWAQPSRFSRLRA